MTSNVVIRGSVLLFIFLALNNKDSYAQRIIPIEFPKYNISIETSFSIGDTVLENYSHDEYFKFVFFDLKGKCYCERYINKKLCEKGYYENSLDTLKKYISKAYAHGWSSKIFVLKFFEPLKNGEWITYKNGTTKKELYVMGVLADKLVRN